MRRSPKFWHRSVLALLLLGTEGIMRWSSTGTKMLESRAWCPLALGVQWGPASQATASGMTITMVTTNRALPCTGQGAELFLWFCHGAKPYVMGSITTSSSQMRS